MRKLGYVTSTNDSTHIGNQSNETNSNILATITMGRNNEN